MPKNKSEIKQDLKILLAIVALGFAIGTLVDLTLGFIIVAIAGVNLAGLFV